jgi:hypothetical protein
LTDAGDLGLDLAPKPLENDHAGFTESNYCTRRRTASSYEHTGLERSGKVTLKRPNEIERAKVAGTFKVWFVDPYSLRMRIFHVKSNSWNTGTHRRKTNDIRRRCAV